MMYASHRKQRGRTAPNRSSACRPNWISTSRALPPACSTVIACYYDDDVEDWGLDLAYMCEGQWYDAFDLLKNKVEYWALVPKTPKI